MSRRVVFLVFPRFQLLDLTGPLEVFSQADMLFSPGRQRYVTEVVALGAEPVTASDGLAVVPHRTLADAAELPIDTLVVVGGRGVRTAMTDPVYVEWVRAAAGRARRVTSVCSGTFLLAAAGLLDGRRAVTHWDSCEELAERFPEIRVEADPIFVRDDPLWTSAGVTAGVDLALALVEDDLGAEVARRIAKQLVVFVQRPGGQAQFSTQLAAQRPGRDALRETQTWIADHLDDNLSLAALARRAALSERHFSRVFRAETGMTVAAYVEAARIEAAQRLLESTRDGLDRIARTCGFGTVETMHRTFNRTIRVTPGEYRRHFSSPR
ncbi:transcriptional regulator, AraC family [Catenulispora acidiphila DSM 44928]|uniref:Transcriptional regulator, AraC family n=1 Tax=Catenulispora acidiphila (strain DSM 44928 / JCM 14897 / NBRC 102108 / NRRL B-24433 / ID139908) TaxID=479433 RepID=C7QHH6_CATAD|nr:GlxA family transcriptional regulator [Catenulispora acidiphila]ACU69115.1 transcriptional regulator, AraC family [Catenulispora acidiphila DSM 44928]